MIRVVVAGDVRANAPLYIVSCPKCLGSFEFEDEDIRRDQQDGSRYVECPTDSCGKLLDKDAARRIQRQPLGPPPRND